MKNIDDYMRDVKSQLLEQRLTERTMQIFFTYTSKQVEEHRDYFNECRENGLSAYKALTFFNSYLQELESKN